MIQKYKKEQQKKYRNLGEPGEMEISLKLGSDNDPGPTMPTPEPSGPFAPDSGRKGDVISISRAEYEELCRMAGM